MFINPIFRRSDIKTQSFSEKAENIHTRVSTEEPLTKRNCHKLFFKSISSRD